MKYTLQCLLFCSSVWQPSGWWMQAPFLYSRGKCTDIFVPTEWQADCSKGSTLVEHFRYLRGQIACWGHEHFSEVTRPGCRLFLRSAIWKKQERCVQLWTSKWRKRWVNTSKPLFILKEINQLFVFLQGLLAALRTQCTQFTLQGTVRPIIPSARC